MGDKQIIQRMKLDRQWYDYNTSLRLIQTHGRGMRYEEDYCTTYVVDSRFRDYVSLNHILPDTFKNAIIHPDMDNIVRKGEDLITNGDYRNALKYYNDLINKNVFVNDAYPYLTLSKIYREMGIYDAEVNIIVRFLKSGISCSDREMTYFKNRLR